MLKKRLLGFVFSGLLTYGAFGQEAVVRIAPPHAVVEARTPMPSPGLVWVAGYHHWNGQGYDWIPGRWERPPHPRARWVAHHWVHRHGGWILVEGHWRA
jgi:hypothetical protein